MTPLGPRAGLAGAHCDGTVVVHEDRTFTCTNAGCGEVDSLPAAVSGHIRFVPCRSVFSDQGCPRCSAAPSPPAPTGGRLPTRDLRT